MDVIQVLDNRNYFQTQFLARVQALSLSFGQQVDRLDSLAYIESINDAYSQYFVNDKNILKTQLKVQTIT